MAKGSSARGNVYGTPSSLTSLLALKPTAYRPVALAPTPQEYLTYAREPDGDGRTYNPTKTAAPPSALIRAATRLHIGNVGMSDKRNSRPGLLPRTTQFAIPNVVAICVRRKQRREVLHALSRIAKPGKGASRRRRSFWSDVKC